MYIYAMYMYLLIYIYIISLGCPLSTCDLLPLPNESLLYVHIFLYYCLVAQYVRVVCMNGGHLCAHGPLSGV